MLAQVVEDAHKAVIWILPILDKMPRTRRFGLGQRIENHLLQLIVLLSQAGYSHKKLPILQAANLELVDQIVGASCEGFRKIKYDSHHR